MAEKNLKFKIVNNKISDNLFMTKPEKHLDLHFYFIPFSLIFKQIFDRFTSV